MVAERTRLYLVRHCDVRNPEGVLYGHLPGFGLSEKGVRQAHDLGAYLAATPARQIYSSPLERAQQTAQIIASHLGGVPITTTDDLIETKFGHYLEGIRPRDVPWRRPLWFAHLAWPGLLPNDESPATMARRIQRPLDLLLDDHPGMGGICISHGDPIQAFSLVAERRHRYALHRLQCHKGGLLELDYEGRVLVGKRYRPPTAGTAAAPAA